MNQLLIKLLRSPVYYILLIAEKNKEVCYLTSDLFHFNIQIQPEQNIFFSLSLSMHGLLMVFSLSLSLSLSVKTS